MPNEKTGNSDLRIVCHKIDTLEKRFGQFLERHDQWHLDTQNRLREAEKQSALLQQTVVLLCDRQEKLEIKQDRNDLWTKILGAGEGFLILILTYLGIRK